MRTFFLCVGLLLFASKVFAHEYRNLLQAEVSMDELSRVLLQKNEWIKYPDYADRAGWDKLVAKHKVVLIF